MLVDNYSDIIGAYPAYPYYDSHDSLFEIFSGTYCILACSFVYSDMSSGMSFCKCLKCFGTYFLTHLLAFFDIRSGSDISSDIPANSSIYILTFFVHRFNSRRQFVTHWAV